MALISLLDVSLSFGGAPLLDRVNLQIDRGERVCLLGRNGAGKSTLMKVIAGELKPDAGQVFRSPPDAVIATLRQEVPVDLGGAVRTVIEGEADAEDSDKPADNESEGEDDKKPGRRPGRSRAKKAE